MGTILQGLTPELKGYYSRRLLERLVPALQHADQPLDPETMSEEERDGYEMQNACSKWIEYFEPFTGWDNGYYHDIITV